MLHSYLHFYGVEQPGERLLELARTLIARPEEGSQLIARDDDGRPLGFATVYWRWETLGASRAAVMNDLYVKPDARGAGIGTGLIEACRRLARDRGVSRLTWQTAPDNERAQRVYERLGATREQWVDYWIDTGIDTG